MRYFPKAISFIESCICNAQNENNDSSVLVHCVYGQSRSCATCIAYLMYKAIRSSPDEYDVLLSKCYAQLLQLRPCMAINPGFMCQLEIFRRMYCGIYKEVIRPPILTESSSYDNHEISNQLLRRSAIKANSVKHPPQSKAYATFRSFKFMTDYNNNISKLSYHLLLPQNKKLLTSWVALINKHENKSPRPNGNTFYCCRKCRYILFSNWNIPYYCNKLNDESNLPSSSYWELSKGGELAKKQIRSMKRDNEINYHDYFPLEPMEWMNSDTNNFGSKEKLSCPKCKSKICLLCDWNVDSFVFIFIHKSIIDSFTIHV